MESRVMRPGFAMSLFAIAILMAACSQPATPSGSSNATGAAPAQGAAAVKGHFREGLAGVDFAGLEPAAKERALDIMNAQGCDCGCGMLVAECRVKDQT